MTRFQLDRFYKRLSRLVGGLLLAGLLAACQPVPALTPTARLEPAPTRTAAPAPATARFTPTPADRATASPTASRQIEVQPSQLQGLELTFWHPWQGALARVIEDQVSEFNRSNPWGLRASAAPQDSLDLLAARTAQALEGKDFPDLVAIYPYQALGWQDGQALVDLGPYLTDPEWGLSTAAVEDFYPAFWEQDVISGRHLGLPALRSGQFLYYNQTWANELGFRQPPGTAEEFQQQACAASQSKRQDDDPGNDRSGGWLVSVDYSGMLGWLRAFGGQDLFSPQGGYQFASPAAESAFTYLRGLLDQGCAWLAEDTRAEDEFAARGGLFVTGSLLGIPDQALDLRQSGSQDRWTVIPFPGPDRSAISVYGPSYMVLQSTSERQLGAWLLVRWLAEPAQAARLAEAGGAFPTSRAALALLQDYAEEHPQWAAGVDLLEVAYPEPGFASWERVRWAVSDAATQLFRYYFTAAQVPELVELLDETAGELHGEVP